MDYGTCRSCPARIIWVTMAKSGKTTCLDAEPVENGNIVLHEDGRTAYMLKKGEAYVGPRYRSHFVSCPEAKTLWRRK